ncbi:chaperonin 10-like protein [Suillus lakei]|nr:chaperonin 10-like protein [Suillus lakei]
MSLQQKALILPKKQGDFEVTSRSIPTPAAGQLLVKIQSAALNPVDYKIKNTGIFVTHYPAILGTDIAGIVEEVGEGVKNFRKGDRVLDKSFPRIYLYLTLVYRLAHGSFSNDLAAFQQYTLTVASFTAKLQLPVPLGLDTALVGLVSDNHESKKPIVIIGGSSSVGSYTIQLARLSGFYPIITTASPSNEDLLMAGHQAKLQTAPSKSFMTLSHCQKHSPLDGNCLRESGTLVLTLPATVKEDEGKGRKVISTFASPHVAQNTELCSSSWTMVEKWLSEGTIQPNKYEVLPNGLVGIIGGLERMKLGQVSGTKLVAHPQETQ